MSKEREKCAGCEKMLPSELLMDGLDGKKYCEVCWEEDLQDGDKLFLSEPDGDRWSGTIGSFAAALPNGLEGFRTRWVRTGGWSGHGEAKAPSGWTRVLSGWFSTCGDHISGDGSLERFRDKWDTNKENPPVEMVVVFPKTSNCCACGIDVFVKDEDVETFEKWLY